MTDDDPDNALACVTRMQREVQILEWLIALAFVLLCVILALLP